MRHLEPKGAAHPVRKGTSAWQSVGVAIGTRATSFPSSGISKEQRKNPVLSLFQRGELRITRAAFAMTSPASELDREFNRCGLALRVGLARQVGRDRLRLVASVVLLRLCLTHRTARLAVLITRENFYRSN
jgi:hypothetical protein